VLLLAMAIQQQFDYLISFTL